MTRRWKSVALGAVGLPVAVGLAAGDAPVYRGGEVVTVMPFQLRLPEGWYRTMVESSNFLATAAGPKTAFLYTGRDAPAPTPENVKCEVVIAHAVPEPNTVGERDARSDQVHRELERLGCRRGELPVGTNAFPCFLSPGTARTQYLVTMGLGRQLGLAFVRVPRTGAKFPTAAVRLLEGMRLLAPIGTETNRRTAGPGAAAAAAPKDAFEGAVAVAGATHRLAPRVCVIPARGWYAAERKGQKVLIYTGAEAPPPTRANVACVVAMAPEPAASLKPDESVDAALHRTGTAFRGRGLKEERIRIGKTTSLAYRQSKSDDEGYLLLLPVGRTLMQVVVLLPGKDKALPEAVKILLSTATSG